MDTLRITGFSRSPGYLTILFMIRFKLQQKQHTFGVSAANISKASRPLILLSNAAPCVYANNDRTANTNIETSLHWLTYGQPRHRRII